MLNQQIQVAPIEQELPYFPGIGQWNTDPGKDTLGIQLTDFPSTYAKIGGSSREIEQAGSDRGNAGYHNRCAGKIPALVRCSAVGVPGLCP